jgi:RHS repeat-associated protein
VQVCSENVCYTYTYDAFNRRLKKECTTTNGALWWTEHAKSGTEYYLWALENEIGALDANHSLTELRILGEGLGAEIGAAIALELNSTTYIPLHDRQGNIALLLDLKGTPVETYHYDAFGNETVPENPISPWRFSSKRVDPETGLVYFGRRYYDPTLGKWLTQDPLGLKAGPNLYAYVLNCPMTMFDLYGLREGTERAICNRVHTRNGDHVLRRAYREYTLDGEPISEADLGKEMKSWVSSKWQQYSENLILDYRITFVNGILNTEAHAMDHLKYISSLAPNAAPDNLYNASHTAIPDLLECFFQTKIGGYSNSSRLLKADMEDFYARSPNVVRLLVSFSQGAAVVKGALELVKDYKVRKSIISVAFGPAAIIPSDLCLKSYNYISTGDVVPWIADPSGIALNRDCVYFLNRHQDAAPFPFDHAFQSPTYQERLGHHLDEYLDVYGKKG